MATRKATCMRAYGFPGRMIKGTSAEILVTHTASPVSMPLRHRVYTLEQRQGESWQLSERVCVLENELPQFRLRNENRDSVT